MRERYRDPESNRRYDDRHQRVNEPPRQEWQSDDREYRDHYQPEEHKHMHDQQPRGERDYMRNEREWEREGFSQSQQDRAYYRQEPYQSNFEQQRDWREEGRGYPRYDRQEGPWHGDEPSYSERSEEYRGYRGDPREESSRRREERPPYRPEDHYNRGPEDDRESFRRHPAQEREGYPVQRNYGDDQTSRGGKWDQSRFENHHYQHSAAGFDDMTGGSNDQGRATRGRNRSIRQGMDGRFSSGEQAQLDRERQHSRAISQRDDEPGQHANYRNEDSQTSGRVNQAFRTTKAKLKEGRSRKTAKKKK